jgi:hypothetical protein
MKFLKADGTVEDGTALTDEQAIDMEYLKDLLHKVVCKHETHYNWKGEGSCVKIARLCAEGSDFRKAFVDVFDPAPEPVTELDHPSPIPTGVEA